MNTDSEEKIRDAFRRIWSSATNQPGKGRRALMTIPVDEENDADCIMHRAMDELFELRKSVTSPPEK